MFELESSIAEWRRQMLAAGVSNPELLNELESHLRDGIEDQMNKGTPAPQAFEEAARRLGPGLELHREFENATLNEAMKQKLRNILTITALLAIGMGFLLPQIAAWRVHVPGAVPHLTPFLIGVAIFGCGIAWAARGLILAMKGRTSA